MISFLPQKMECSEKNEIQESEKIVTFKSLGVADVLCDICKKLGWEKPTAIQQEAIPAALQGHDIIGLAKTGSGKTGAYAIPVLQAFSKAPQRTFALVLTPTRELAFQVAEQFEVLGVSMEIKTAVIVGGIDMITQSIALSKRPHIIIGTPGRLVDHLENTKGFSLKAIKFLILDEADRMLNKDFEQEVDRILKAVPKDRHTYLYSATMTQKVKKLQRASLTDPVRVEISKKHETVDELQQYYVSVPLQHKAVYLAHVLFELADKSIMVFCETCAGTNRMSFLLKSLGFAAIPLHGKLNQEKRLSVLQKFKSKKNSVLVTTDVASRGLDIPHVDVVINYDIPSNPKDYIHRVGRTARAGREGKSITFVTQFVTYLIEAVETYIGKKLKLYPIIEDDAMVLEDRVREAQLFANKQMRELERKHKGRKHKNNVKDDDDTEESTGVRNRLKKKLKTK